MQRRDDNVKAMAALDRALEINPAMVEAHLDRQWLLASTGRGAEAVKELETARAIDPLHPDVLRDLAHLLNLQGKRREAFAVLDQLRAVNAESAIETELHLYNDNQDQARGAFIASRYLDADPENKSALEWLTSFNQTLGLNQEVAASKDDRRYIALAVLGRRAEAEAAARKLLSTTEDPASRALIEQTLRLALGDLDGAEHLLLDSWKSNALGAVGNEFSTFQAINLVSLLQAQRRQPPAAEVRRRSKSRSRASARCIRRERSNTNSGLPVQWSNRRGGEAARCAGIKRIPGALATRHADAADVGVRRRAAFRAGHGADQGQSRRATGRAGSPAPLRHEPGAGARRVPGSLAAYCCFTRASRLVCASLIKPTTSSR